MTPNHTINQKSFGTGCQALDPDYIKVDERSLIDRLNFVSRYAELINFYDQHNRPCGNWTALFFKDPVILLASISKTDYSLLHTMFIELKAGQMRELGPLIECRTPTMTSTLARVSSQRSKHSRIQYQLLERMFDLTLSVYGKINGWMEHMQFHSKCYDLKDYVFKRVKGEFAASLSQLLSTRRVLCNEGLFTSPPDNQLPRRFVDTWVSTACMETIENYDPRTILALLDRNFDEVFSFYMQIIDAAALDFNRQLDNANDYPDSALLIAFLKLMEVQQKELNTLTGKHLEFYFSEVLKQTPRKARSDKTFLHCHTRPGLRDFVLPAGTLFSGGLYPDKTALLFESVDENTLNDITIGRVLTSNYESATVSTKLPSAANQDSKSSPASSSVRKQLRISEIKDPTVVKRNAYGEVQSWDMFGTPGAPSANHGFAFATPLLYLAGGKRKIIVELNPIKLHEDETGCNKNTVCCSETEKGKTVFKSAKVFLTTAKGWHVLSLKPEDITQNRVGDSTAITITLNLQPSVPPIEAFPESGDVKSEWPVLKVLLGNDTNLLETQTLTAFRITTYVTGLNRLVVAGDNGTMSARSAFTPFGPVADVGNNFYVGSREMFAKPLSCFRLNLTWDKLPSSFSEYYRPYSDYLNQRKSGVPYTNDSFKVCLDVLDGSVWQNPFQVSSRIAAERPESGTDQSQTSTDQDGNDPHEVNLFETKCTSGMLAETVSFEFKQPNQRMNPKPIQKLVPQLNPDAQLIRQKVLRFSPDTVSGFVRMTLTLPHFGFGNDLYPKIVAQVTMDNALQIAKRSTLIGRLLLSAKKMFQRLFRIIWSINTRPFHIVGVILRLVKAILKRIWKGIPAFRKAGSLLWRRIPTFRRGGSKLVAAIKNVLRGLWRDIPTFKKLGVRLLTSIQNAEPIVARLFAALTGKPSASNKADGTDGLKPLPPRPYTPKVSQLTADYSAVLETTLSAGRTKSSEYPCQFFHLNGFAAYPVFDTTGNLAQANSAVPIYPILSGTGVVYISLENVVAPETVSLFFKLDSPSRDEAAGDRHYASQEPALANIEDSTGVDFAYLTDCGWKTLIPLNESTRQFSSTGIVVIALPDDISVDNPMLPTGSCWLRLAIPRRSAGRIRVAYLNTQMLLAKRTNPNNVDVGDLPRLAADTISGTAKKTPEIVKVTQPFSSFDGKAAEGAPNFYYRVSKRLKSKDRVCSRSDIAESVELAFPNVYRARPIGENARHGAVRVGLVRAYLDSTDVAAFRPHLDARELMLVKEFIRSRVSPAMDVSVVNLRHQVVKVNATMVFRNSDNSKLLCQSLSQQIKHFLSPWVEGVEPTTDSCYELRRAQIVSVMLQFPEVIRLEYLNIVIAKDAKKQFPDRRDTFYADNDSIFVSADEHKIHACA